jgi:hypothetical protein
MDGRSAHLLGNLTADPGIRQGAAAALPLVVIAFILPVIYSRIAGIVWLYGSLKSN